MAQYLVAIHHPDDFDPSVETEAVLEDIHARNREMIAAGVRAFVGGLGPASRAKSLRAQTNGKVLITDGPYLGDGSLASPRQRLVEVGNFQHPKTDDMLLGLQLAPPAGGRKK